MLICLLYFVVYRYIDVVLVCVFFSSRRLHTRCALVPGVQTCALPISCPPFVALIAGPTASVKSALSVALAERHRGTVINADSAQVYADLHVLSARPTREEEARDRKSVV